VKQPDHFVEAKSRLAMALDILLNGGYVCSDRDQHLANRIESILLACKEAEDYYDKQGMLK
jgi:hypothetical protein